MSQSVNTDEIDTYEKTFASLVQVAKDRREIDARELELFVVARQKLDMSWDQVALALEIYGLDAEQQAVKRYRALCDRAIGIDTEV